MAETSHRVIDSLLWQRKGDQMRTVSTGKPRLRLEGELVPGNTCQHQEGPGDFIKVTGNSGSGSVEDK